METWEEYPMHPEYQVEVDENGVWTNWQRCTNGWNRDGWWAEHHTQTGEKRWRLVRVDSAGKPVDPEPDGCPVTIDVSDTDPH